jgi:hypothetical protein
MTPNYLRLLELIRDRGITTIRPTDRPRRIELGSVTLTIFPQARESPADKSDHSVGTRVQYGDLSIVPCCPATLSGPSEPGGGRTSPISAPTARS